MVNLIGSVKSELEEVRDGVYSYILSVQRENGVVDDFEVRTTRRKNVQVGAIVEIIGEVRVIKEDGGRSYFVMEKNRRTAKNRSEHFNTVMISGNLIADPKCVGSKSKDNEIVRFTINKERAYAKLNQTDYITCFAWHPYVQYVESKKEGDKLHVIGRLQTQEYTNADGETRRIFEITTAYVF